jgi:hypothetical protein
MTRSPQSAAALPAGFAELEPFASHWCLPTERERYAKRLASSIDEMQALYDAVAPRLDDALAHCDQFPLEDLPDDTSRLLQLLHSFVMVSFPVEVYRHPHIPEIGDARLDRVAEPSL